jgi:hypothetical protein
MTAATLSLLNTNTGQGRQLNGSGGSRMPSSECNIKEKTIVDLGEWAKAIQKP